MWYAIDHEPTMAQVNAAPLYYGVVILNSWDTWALQRIKQADSSVTVLMYKDLSSTRSSAESGSQMDAGGVGYQSANPAWFATNTVGSRIEWQPYPGQWQMAVWDAGYQLQWAENVEAQVVSGGWDGVLADNDLSSLSYYSSDLLAGTSTQGQTDEKLRAGLDAMVALVGTKMVAAHKLFIPNVSDARLYPGRWQLHSRYGGAMEENFVHWGTSVTGGYLADWDQHGWQVQTDEMSTPGLSLAITQASPTDRAALLFGYTSLLVRGDASSYWSPSTMSTSQYSKPESIVEMTWPIGGPATSAIRFPSGVWARTFQGAFVIVNPTTSGVEVSVPAGFVNASGTPVSTVYMAATSGLLIQRG